MLNLPHELQPVVRLQIEDWLLFLLRTLFLLMHIVHRNKILLLAPELVPHLLKTARHQVETLPRFRVLNILDLVIFEFLLQVNLRDLPDGGKKILGFLTVEEIGRLIIIKGNTAANRLLRCERVPDPFGGRNLSANC